MRKVIAIIILGLIIAAGYASAAPAGKDKHINDTLSIKCMLYSARLFYGIELGEKPIRDLVDTLVAEIPEYDSAADLNLIVLSGRDLGFKKHTGLRWDQILDSAESKGYELCPPQVAPELYVMSQNMPEHSLLKHKAVEGKPIFIGMDRIRHIHDAKAGLLGSLFSHSRHFDYVFCLKTNPKQNNYELGYSATNSVNEEKSYIWGNDDLFIFVNKNKKSRVSGQYCKN